jgi:divalent metal cation (Fe/Co/Zn/Cd) transporter
MLTANARYDALGSLAIGVPFLIVAVFVGIEVKALLVGQCAEPALQKEARRSLMVREAIVEVLNLITLQKGADVLAVVNTRMTESLSATVLVEAISRCERALRAAFPPSALAALRARHGERNAWAPLPPSVCAPAYSTRVSTWRK